MDDQQYQIFKIVIVGDSNTGKTNIALRFIKNQFYDLHQATIGIEFFNYIINIDDCKIKVNFWDTAGQQRYKSLSKQYFKGAAGIILVYDITQPKSYVNLESWLKLVRDNTDCKSIKLIVLGNKVDRQSERKIPYERVKQEFEQKYKIRCYETSAKDNIGIQQSMMYLIRQIYNMMILHQEDNQKDVDQQQDILDSLILEKIAKKKQSKNKVLYSQISHQFSPKQKQPQQYDKSKIISSILLKNTKQQKSTKKCCK